MGPPPVGGARTPVANVSGVRWARPAAPPVKNCWTGGMSAGAAKEAGGLGPVPPAVEAVSVPGCDGHRHARLVTPKACAHSLWS